MPPRTQPTFDQIQAALAAARLRALMNAESSYLGFINYLYPNRKHPPFHLKLINTLDLLEKRQLFHPVTGAQVFNLLITMPPRHAKSEYGTKYFPAYFMGRDPRRYTMSASYNGDLGKSFGRYVRNVLKTPEYQEVFPQTIIASDSRAVDHWGTTAKGEYFGIGLNGTTSGRPANLLIVDDPIKSRPEAESPTVRNKVWDFYTGSLENRMQPEVDGEPPIQVIILTRWHPDDLAGRLMETEEWKQGRWLHIDFPALEGDFEHPSTLRALWPERFSVEDLLRKRRLSPRDFESLYQQRPFLKGGNLLREEWLQPYDYPDPQYMQVIITADTAHKAKDSNDPSVFLVAGITLRGDIHILDVVRERLEFPDLKRRLIALNAAWRGRGLRATYIEEKASGDSLIQEMRRESGISVIGYKVGSQDKTARLNNVLPLVEGGRVFVPSAALWLDDFLAELTQFPASKHDDQVDAFTMAIDILSRAAISPEMIELQFQQALSLNNLQQANMLGKSLAEHLKVDGTKGRAWGDYGRQLPPLKR